MGRIKNTLSAAMSKRTSEKSTQMDIDSQYQERSNPNGIPVTINLDEDIEVVLLDEEDGYSTESADEYGKIESECDSLSTLQDNVSGCTDAATTFLVNEEQPLSSVFTDKGQSTDMQKATTEIGKLREALASAYTMLTACQKQNEDLHKVLKKAKLPPYNNLCFRSVSVQTTDSEYMEQESEFILPDVSSSGVDSGLCKSDTPKLESILLTPSNRVMSNNADMATLHSIPKETNLPIQNHKTTSFCKILPKILRRKSPEKPYNIRVKDFKNYTVNDYNKISLNQTPNLQFLPNMVQNIDQNKNTTVSDLERVFYIIPLNSDTNQSNLNITQDLQGNPPLNSQFVIPMYQSQNVIQNPTPKTIVNKNQTSSKVTSSSTLIDDREYALTINEITEEPMNEVNSLLPPPQTKEIPKNKKSFASDDIEDNLPHAIIVNSCSNNVISNQSKNENSVQVYTVLNSIDLTENNKNAPKKSHNFKNMKHNENSSCNSTDPSLPSIVSTVSLASNSIPNRTDSNNDVTEMPSIVSVQSLSVNKGTDSNKNNETDTTEISQINNDAPIQKVYRKTLNFGIVRP